MWRIKSLLFLLAMAAQLPLASATVTYVVGSCKPTLPSFTTINGALTATQPPNVVEVCPGTYPEQVVITLPVTIEGISDGNSTRAVITVPPGGLMTNYPNAAAQVFVENVSGNVNFSNLTIDGAGNNVACTDVTCPFIVGILYQGSPGTVNHVTLQNQSGHEQGVGIWLEGGPANPTVTVENSNLREFDNTGIVAEDAFSVSSSGVTITGAVTADVKGNYVTTSVAPDPAGASGFGFAGWATISVTGNLITGVYTGMVLANGSGVTGPVLKNTVVGTHVGIDAVNCCAQITSNAIYNSSIAGIIAAPATTPPAGPISGNTVVQSPIGIEFDCFAGDEVHSNTILGAAIGLDAVPSGVVSADTYYNVGTLRTTGAVINGYCQLTPLSRRRQAAHQYNLRRLAGD